MAAAHSSFAQSSFDPNICDILKYIDETKAEQIVESTHDLLSKMTKKKRRQLSEFQKNIDDGVLVVGLAVNGEPAFERLCEIDDKGVHHELLLRFQGIIIKKNLPPIRRIGQIHDHVRYLFQGVDVVGFGSPMFANAWANLLTIRDISNRVDIIPFDGSTYRGFPVISTTNRYFTEERHARHEVLSNKPSFVDPLRILAKAAAASTVPLVTSPDNDVEYFRNVEITKPDDTKVIKMEDCHPDAFEVGDFVEVGFSVVLYPTADRKKKKMVVVLRSIALLDDSLRREANQKARLALLREVPVTTKRKVRTYDSDEEEEAAERKGYMTHLRMEVDNQGNRMDKMTLGN